jgi:hypothetical protein
MLAETNWSDPLDSQIAEILLPSGAKLAIQQIILDRADADAIYHALSSEKSLDLTAHFPDAPPIPISYMRDVIVPAFGREATHTRCAYGLPDPGLLFPAPSDVEPVITELTQQLGFDFEHKYPTHLGGFDFFSLGAWLEGPSPYGFDLAKEPHEPMPTGGRVLRFGNTDQQQIAQISVISEGEQILNRLVLLPPGVKCVDVAMQSLMDSYCLRIYGGSDSALEYEETAHFIRAVGGNLVTLERTVQLSDALTRKAQAHGKEAAARAEATTAVRTTHFVTEYDPTKLRAYRRNIGLVLGAAIAPVTNDRWFPRTFESEIGVIDYLNSLIARNNVREAILVDPFFGADALLRTIMRITQTNMLLTIVTSWGRTDPDTGEELTKSPLEAEQKSVARLSELLEQAGAHVAPTLRLLNLTTEAGRQAFHDRYLLLEPLEGGFQVFLLSNSLNAMALHWPYCVVELTGRAKFDAASYIKALANGQDLASETPPKITFRWPQNQPTAS